MTTLSTRGVVRPIARPLTVNRGLSRDKATRWVLGAMFFITLFRATGMWYGYPAVFEQGVGVDPMPLQLILYSLVPLLVAYACLEPTRLLSYAKRATVLVYIVSFFCVLSVLKSIDVMASLRGLIAVVLLAISVLLYRLRYGNEETMKAFVNFTIICLYINAAYTAVCPQYAIMRGHYNGDLRGMLLHKNLFGHFSAVSFVLLFSLKRETMRFTWKNIIYWGAILIAMADVVFSKSSTAIIMVVIGLSAVYAIRWLQKIPNPFNRAMILLFAVIGGVIGLSIIFLVVISVIATFFGKDLTFSGRSEIWSALLPLIYDKPWTGYGFAISRQPTFMAEYVHLSWGAKSTHNTYIEMLLNIGVIGVGAWLLYIFTRIFQKLTTIFNTASLKEAQAKEVAIILMIVAGSMAEAGMMLAPLYLWPCLVLMLPLAPGPRSLSQGRSRRPVRAFRPIKEAPSDVR